MFIEASGACLSYTSYCWNEILNKNNLKWYECTADVFLFFHLCTRYCVVEFSEYVTAHRVSFYQWITWLHTVCHTEWSNMILQFLSPLCSVLVSFIALVILSTTLFWFILNCAFTTKTHCTSTKQLPAGRQSWWLLYVVNIMDIYQLKSHIYYFKWMVMLLPCLLDVYTQHHC